MMSTNHSLKMLHYAFILFIFVSLLFPTTALGKRHSGGGRSKATRGRTGRKLSARERHSGRRLARVSRRGGRNRMSARERRRERELTAREQRSALQALERRLHRPLTKRERAAELRRFGSKHRREIEEARRRAEAARQAAIARQRALDKALRDEVQGLIAKDDATGEDPEVRRVAVNALGNHAGTVVVMDPMNGRVYSIVNQEWALRRGFKPCSTIKLVTGVAGLSEKIIAPVEFTTASDRAHMDLTSALAHSDNPYFERVGSNLGFDKMISYARQLGLGEKTEIKVPYEYPGRLPELKPGFALHRMFSYADGFEVTPVQLGTLVSAMANGGRLLVPQLPRTAKELADFKSKVRRNLGIDSAVWQRMVPGMVGSVNYGSGRRAYDPIQTVAGKTGTCIGEGGWVGLFASYAPLANPRLAVVVIARGTDAHGHLPAAVAGQIYRELNRRFGTPTNLPIASTPDDEEKEVEAEPSGAPESTDQPDPADAAAAKSTATVTVPVPKSTVQPSLPRSTVKRVLMPIERRNPEIPKADTQKLPLAIRPLGGGTTQPDVRPRRAQPSLQQ